ncbi:hypothetical protein EDE08_101662 [Bradyrhizobium sp. R2.2-H]|jgi:hypothetical protein|uniref:hypothetical protein n=1 Tax=unclassified Bradyrhizobium TaxID=2631580 RepID=UPI00104A4E09|nr:MULTISPECIES: hypothetical protein [unclassified Bradyrhizobium]TCU78879.1 hypothetical protein EDE10_101663 [Bradyrhizobium sp. Y-H1]TCU80962.1 hypothetical protein EDE08_101662 [Bradyrhizobium sp. R2.2-H]
MRCIEYEFVLPDGSARYEMVDPDAGYTVMHQVNLFMRMHGATIARPLQHGTMNDGRTTAIPSSEQQQGTLAG